MPSSSTSETPHSRPMRDSAAAAWALLKINQPERVKRVIDRMTPDIVEEAPPANIKMKEDDGQILARPDLPEGFDPDGPVDWQWIEFRIEARTVAVRNKPNIRQMKLACSSTRPKEWRRAQWGMDRDKISTRMRLIGHPDVLQGQEAIDRYWQVCKAAIAFYCRQHGPDADCHQDFPWQMESAAIAKSFVQWEFARRKDQSDYHATKKGKLWARLRYFPGDKADLSSSYWQVAYAHGVIGTSWSWSTPAQRTAKDRFSVDIVASSMVNDPPRPIDESIFNSSDPMAFPKMTVILDRWHEFYPHPTSAQIVERDRQIAWMTYAHYMTAPYNKCQEAEFRRQYKVIIEQSRTAEYNRSMRSGRGDESWLTIAHVGDGIDDRMQVQVPPTFVAGNALDKTYVRTGIMIPKDVLEGGGYRAAFLQTQDLWLSNRDPMMIMDALVKIFDYLQGYDTDAEHYLSSFTCPHFEKDGAHPCISGCGKVMTCAEVEEQSGLSICSECHLGQSEDRYESWPKKQIVKSAVGSAFPATFYGDLSRAVGTRQKAVINLKTKLGDSDKGYFKIANEVELMRTIGSQLVDGKPVDQLCPGGIIERSENPMMRLTLVKPYRLVVADDPPKNYLWHQRELGLTRSAFGRLKYTHTGYTACLLIQAMGITQSHTRLTDRARAFLDGIAQKLNKAWILEVQLPHLRRALVSAEPSSYTSILEEMHQLDLADEKDLQAVEGGNSPTAHAERNVDPILFVPDTKPSRSAVKSRFAIACKIVEGMNWLERPHLSRNDNTLDWEKSLKFKIVRSPSGWPYPFEADTLHASFFKLVGADWDDVSIDRWFGRALTTLTMKCNRHFKTDEELNPNTLYLTACYWVIHHRGRCHFSGLSFSPFPRHPARMSLGKRCHGQAMTSGWSTGTPDSSSDFDPDACNICPEVWPANSFKWCYTREQIEEMVFKAMVPSARAASNEVMGLRTSLPPMVGIKQPVASTSKPSTVSSATTKDHKATSSGRDQPAESSSMADQRHSGPGPASNSKRAPIHPGGNDLGDKVVAATIRTKRVSAGRQIELERSWYTSAVGSDEELTAILDRS